MSPSVTDWRCIRQTPTGYIVKVEVRPLPATVKRYKAGTPLGVMQAWRDGTRKALEARRDARADHGAATLADDVRTYLSQWGAGKHRETVSQRARHLEAWAAAFPGRTRADLTTTDIEAQLAAWQAAPPPTQRAARPEPEGPATWNKRRQALLQVYVTLDRGTSRRNPVKDVPLAQEPKATARGVPYPVIRQILAAMPRSKTRARLGVMAFTGLRPEEVRRITPEDIDQPGRRLYVRTAKGGDSATVPLVPEAESWLQEFHATGAYGAFTSAPMGQSLRRAVARVNAARYAAGQPALTGITAYTMRHSYGTALYRATKDLKVVKEGMRHKSLTMSERYVEGAVSDVLAQGTARLAMELADPHADPQSDPHGVPNVEISEENHRADPHVRRGVVAPFVRKRAR